MISELTSGPLTPDQRIRKNKYEAKIRTHIASFWEAGEALMGMHDERLYREDFATFEAYCDARWGFSDRHARRLIFGANVVGIIGPVGPQVKERAIREFAAIEPDEYQPTWEQVVEASKGGKISATLVKRVIKAATGAAIEIVQTQGNVTIAQASIPLVEASVTEQIAETQSRQIQHIADNSSWDRLSTFETTVSEAAQRLEEAMVSLDSSKIIKISIYIAKETQS